MELNQKAKSTHSAKLLQLLNQKTTKKNIPNWTFYPQLAILPPIGHFITNWTFYPQLDILSPIEHSIPNWPFKITNWGLGIDFLAKLSGLRYPQSLVW